MELFLPFNIWNRFLPIAGTKRHLNIGAETLALRLRGMFSKVSGFSSGQTLNNNLSFSSGRFNYRVGDVFRELMGCASASGGANSNSGTLYHRIGGSSAGYSSTESRSRMKGKCNILWGKGQLCPAELGQRILTRDVYIFGKYTFTFRVKGIR